MTDDDDKKIFAIFMTTLDYLRNFMSHFLFSTHFLRHSVTQFLTRTVIKKFCWLRKILRPKISLSSINFCMVSCEMKNEKRKKN